MPGGGDDDGRFAGLGMLASALAARPVAVTAAAPGAVPWTDGKTVFVDPSASPRTQLESVAVQASLIAAGSLDPDVLGALVRHRRLAGRYLAVEGHRALLVNRALLPNSLGALADPRVCEGSDSPAASLAMVSGKGALPDPPTGFGAIQARKVLAACAAAKPVDERSVAHVPRRDEKQELEELARYTLILNSLQF